jgi:hypothetical protein
LFLMILSAVPRWRARPHVNYPELGELSIYENVVIIRVPITVPSDAKAGTTNINGSLQLQCCDSASCYPPERIKFAIQTEILAAGEKTTAVEPELFADGPATRSATAPSPPTAGN